MRRPITWPTTGIIAGTAGMLVVVIVAVVAAWWVLGGDPDEPGPGPVAPPEGSPGTLLSAGEWDGQAADSLRVWEIEYVSRTHAGEPATATGLVVSAKQPQEGPRPVLAWAHGTAGVSRECAPSESEVPFGIVSGLIGQMALEGWVVVATDYVGLGTPGDHAYLSGPDAANDVLHSITAAHEMDEVDLADRSVVWGGSQGGHAALWAGQLADEVAPHLDLAGVAALAPPTDLTDTVPAVGDNRYGRSVLAYLRDSWSRAYPDRDVWGDVPEETRAIAEDLAERCQDEMNGIQVSRQLDRLGGELSDVGDGDFARLLEQNSPVGPDTDLPVFLAQGTSDELIPVTSQRDWVAKRCEEGLTLDYREYDGLGHVDLLAPTSPMPEDLVAWTADRIAGKPAEPSCQ